MSKTKIHIVSFDVPYPPDYGGIIDIYYKIKALSESGVDVILHTFVYNRSHSKELDKYCLKVYCYKRKLGFFQNLHIKPYIIFSRRSRELLANLILDDAPIIFEGLHTTYYIDHKLLRDRIKIVRTHNIEHQYYLGLAKNTSDFLKRLYYNIEGYKLMLAENKLKYADKIAVISQNDFTYFSNKYSNVFLLWPFHSNDKVRSLEGKGKYLLFHANLSVDENIQAANFLINNVFHKLDFKVIIAGKNPPESLKNNAYENISIVANPDQQKMNNLISHAQAIILYSEQSTGIKLKLMDSLYKGRFVIANHNITSNLDLGNTCYLTNTPDEYLEKIKEILSLEFSNDRIRDRENILKDFNTKINVNKLKALFSN